MEANPLISKQKNSQSLAVLHPLVLLTISDYITRHTLREQKGPIIGAVLGLQNGREVTLEHAFECHTIEAQDQEHGYQLDAAKFAARLEQMVTVHKERNLELVGWYTLLPPSGPSPIILPIHNQILEVNESAVLLGFHPTEVLEHSVGSKLPLTIYESNYEVDDVKDGEDKKMTDDGDAALRLRFHEVPYSVETDETEMISMNYIAAGAGTASTDSDDRPARSIESTGKGKRRLVDTNGNSDESAAIANAYLTKEEDEMVASLTAKANAIKMLQSRVQLITTYLKRLPTDQASPDDHTMPSFPILRQIQALVNRMDLVIPSNEEAWAEELQRESNTVHIVEVLNSVMQDLHSAKDVGKNHGIIQAEKERQNNQSHLNMKSLASPGFSLHAAGDILA